jgi:peroxiredoxin Q/BCP
MPTRPVLITVLLALLCACRAAGDRVPAVGSEAPAFRLQDQAGSWHELKDYRGKWVVLYFYPKDATPGCTTQACEFRDNIFAFDKLNAVILGISLDDVASHQRFAADNHLPFTILADPSTDVAKRYGVLRSALGVMQIASRDTFLIDPVGKIAKYYPNVDPKSHSKVVLADLRDLESKYSP